MGAASTSSAKPPRHGGDVVSNKAPAACEGAPGFEYGVGAIQVPISVLAPIQDVFNRMEKSTSSSRASVVPEWMSDMMPCLGPPSIIEVSGTPYSFHVSEASTTSGMSWLWPRDQKTFSLFLPLFEAAKKAGLQVGPAGVGDLELWSATIIVRRAGELTDKSAELHTDYWHQDVPPGFAHSLLTPLLEMPEGAGGLEFQPWRRPYDPSSALGADGEPDRMNSRVSYKLGQMVCLDGKCLHRTEPYTLDPDAESLIRVIISLDVHTAGPDAAAAGARKSVRAQHNGDIFTRPNPWDEDASTTSGSESDDLDS